MRSLSIALLIGGLSLLLPAKTVLAQDNEGIEFTYIPRWNSLDDLCGRVWSVTPSEHKVAVYICVEGGWWTKPTWANPLTIIEDDSTWCCDVTTGGNDKYAKRFAAFLLPNGVGAPRRSGEQTLLDELFVYPHVIECRHPGNRIINFSGYNWIVKQCEAKIGPGPNYFSDDTSDVWVDEDGQLHMKITYRSGKWYCTEVIADTSFGYRKYVFYVQSRVDSLDQNTVVGLFTWDECAPENNYREIDIEFSRWGIADEDSTAQYVIHPWYVEGNRHRFKIESDTCSTHMFTWDEDSIEFQSLYGHFSTPPCDEYIIESWYYTGSDNPPPGDENPRINFWLFNGQAPSGSQEIIIKGFEFIFDTTIVLSHPIATTPQDFILYPNYPNPFNPITTIKYSLPKDCWVKFDIFNVLGQKVATLVDGEQKAGHRTVKWDTNLFSSGIYFYRLQAGNFVQTRKMILLK